MNVSQQVEATVTTQPTFPELLERLWMEKHTGPVTVHFAQGVPNVIEFPGEPRRIPLTRVGK